MDLGDAVLQVALLATALDLHSAALVGWHQSADTCELSSANSSAPSCNAFVPLPSTAILQLCTTISAKSHSLGVNLRFQTIVATLLSILLFAVSYEVLQ